MQSNGCCDLRHLIESMIKIVTFGWQVYFEWNINSYFSSIFSHKTDYELPNKLEVQVGGGETGLQLEIRKQGIPA